MDDFGNAFCVVDVQWAQKLRNRFEIRTRLPRLVALLE